MKQTIKEIKALIVDGAEFNLKIGKLTIISVEKDGYKKGVDRIHTDLYGKPYVDDISEIAHFIKENQ